MTTCRFTTLTGFVTALGLVLAAGTVLGDEKDAVKDADGAAKKFVADYEKEFGAVPATYAFQAYDAAMLIDGALKATKGNTSDREALRAAMKKADFKSLRGAFRFNTNNYPIQDFYLVKVAKRPDGKFQTEIDKKVFENNADPHAKDCPMK